MPPLRRTAKPAIRPSGRTKAEWPALDRAADLPLVFCFRAASPGCCAAKNGRFAPPAAPQALLEHPTGEAEPAFYPIKASTDAQTLIASPQFAEARRAHEAAGTPSWAGIVH